MRTRYVGGALLVLGIALIVMPFALSMPSRASKGADMVDSFHPIMQQPSVDTTVRYYGLFQQLGSSFGPLMTDQNVTKFRGYQRGLAAMQGELPGMFKALAGQLQMTPAQLNGFLAKNFPAVARGFAAFPQMGKDFSVMIDTMARSAPGFAQVPAALRHYGDLVQRMRTNVGNYAAVDALPSFRAFTWFFVIPGAIVALLGLLTLRGDGPRAMPAGSVASARPTA